MFVKIFEIYNDRLLVTSPGDGYNVYTNFWNYDCDELSSLPSSLSSRYNSERMNRFARNACEKRDR